MSQRRSELLSLVMRGWPLFPWERKELAALGDTTGERAMTQPTDTTFISDHHEAMTNQALGYAWGMQDASGNATAGGDRWIQPALAFARAFADARESRGNAPNVQDAYETWQASEGRAVQGPW